VDRDAAARAKPRGRTHPGLTLVLVTADFTKHCPVPPLAGLVMATPCTSCPTSKDAVVARLRELRSPAACSVVGTTWIRATWGAAR
jgi:hypothetical protein